MSNLPTDERKVFVTLESLGVLANTALRNGTEPAFMEVALKWAEGANTEIERLKREVSRLMAFMPEHDTRESYRCIECGAFHLRSAVDVPAKLDGWRCDHCQEWNRWGPNDSKCTRCSVTRGTEHG